MINTIIKGWPDPAYRKKFGLWTIFVVYEIIFIMIWINDLIHGYYLWGTILWLFFAIKIPAIIVTLIALNSKGDRT